MSTPARSASRRDEVADRAPRAGGGASATAACPSTSAAIGAMLAFQRLTRADPQRVRRGRRPHTCIMRWRSRAPCAAPGPRPGRPPPGTGRVAPAIMHRRAVDAVVDHVVAVAAEPGVDAVDALARAARRRRAPCRDESVSAGMWPTRDHDGGAGLAQPRHDGRGGRGVVVEAQVRDVRGQRHARRAGVGQARACRRARRGARPSCRCAPTTGACRSCAR